MAAQPAMVPDGEALSEIERRADAVLTACHGNPYLATEALVADICALEAELDATRAAVSYGWSRGWHRNGGKPR